MNSNIIPKIIHFSLPNRPSAIQKERIELIRAMHPGWQIMIWDDQTLPPNGRLKHYHGKANSGAQRGDLIRCDAVYEFGGVYLDADMHALKPLDDLLCWQGFIICSEDGSLLTNAFFAAPPRHTALDAIIANWLLNEPDWTRPANETTGPDVFSTILMLREDITILPRETFYPYNWNEVRPASFPPMTYAIHEWENSWITKKPERPFSLKATKASIKSGIKDLFRAAQSAFAKLFPPPTTATVILIPSAQMLLH